MKVTDLRLNSCQSAIMGCCCSKSQPKSGADLTHMHRHSQLQVTNTNNQPSQQLRVSNGNNQSKEKQVDSIIQTTEYKNSVANARAMWENKQNEQNKENNNINKHIGRDRRNSTPAKIYKNDDIIKTEWKYKQKLKEKEKQKENENQNEQTKKSFTIQIDSVNGMFQNSFIFYNH